MTSQRKRTRSTHQRNRRIVAANNICYLCGESGADAADHVIPLSRGGADEAWNLRPAHHNTPNSQGIRCNRAKGQQMPDASLTTSRRW